ncbi:unnamed protein product [Nippostrongylus brasiliensis]|uniref:Pct-1 (inferred by orthology to a C. elegans protein) n=1 Tax=Nippostrongylus brasiliensis TaxID=27835 RepID=A0A0N4YW83_NIPBR|nr:unnamed protein product [Nippostrongylus brasiliensis]
MRKSDLIPPSVSFVSAVVQESPALGSDGESVEVSPCTSDQTPTGVPPRYIVNVKMRQKPSRKWSEEEIQKRLSLPADLRLPVSVVEKLNRTPTLDQPLTRKNRRASLMCDKQPRTLQSEIGFGKLETYEKLDKLGEGTYATVYRGRSLLTNKFVALKRSSPSFVADSARFCPSGNWLRSPTSLVVVPTLEAKPPLSPFAVVSWNVVG